MGLGLQLARAFVRVTVDADGVTQDLDKIKEETEKMLKSLSAGALGIFRPIAQFGKNLLQQGVGSADRYEQMKIELDALTGSAEETQSMLKELTDFAVKTPFEMPQLMQVTKTLMQTGQRGQELMETIKMLGDASGGTAAKFSLLSEVVMLQMAGRTMSMRDQDMRQLSSRGILMAADFAKVTGKSVEEVNKMRFSQEEVLKVLKATTQEGGRNYNMMEKQSQTFSGLKSTLSDAMGIMSRKLVDPMMPLLKTWLNFKIAVADGVGILVDKMGALASGALSGATAFATLGMAIAGGTLAAKVFGLTLRGVLIGSGIGIAVVALGTVIGILVGWITEGITKSEHWEPIIRNLSAAWDTFKDSIGQIIESLSYMWDSVFGTSFAGSMSSATDSIAAFLEYVTEGINWLSDQFAGVANFVSYVFRNAFQLAEKALVDFTINTLDAMPWLRETFSDLSVFLVATWDGIGAAFSAIIDNMILDFKTLVAISQSVGSTIAYVFKEAWSGNLVGLDEVKEKFMQEFAKLVPEGDSIDVTDAFSEAFTKTEQMAREGLEDQGGLLQALKNRSEELGKQVEQRETAFVNRTTKAPDKPDAKDKPTPKAEEPAELIKAGRYGFAQFGTSLQDAILKGKGDKQGQMIDLLAKGNKIQEQQLSEQKKNKPGALSE